MKTRMNPRERVIAALQHEPVDRVPVSGMAWTIGAIAGGYSTKEYSQSGSKMAKGQIAFWEKTGVDLLHPTSDMGQTAEGWGVKMRYENGLTPMLDVFAVNEPGDWEKLRPLDPLKDGRMHVTIDAIKEIRSKLGDKVAIMPYVPSPLTSATHVCNMEQVMMDIVLSPEPLHKGLSVMSDSIVTYIDAIIDAGADGALFATTRASGEITTEDQYREFGANYDYQILKAVRNQGGNNILHVCGVSPHFELLANYPNANGVNWWDRGSNLPVKQAKVVYGRKVCLVAGLDQTTTLILGGPEDIRKESFDAIEAGFGDVTGMILSPGCEISPRTSFDNIKAAVKAAEEFGIGK
ncbi:MAG: uroporphyrinogen decarboxylase family protein [Methanomassiliicoccales archaeon]|nr:uroporphyrinogen decarboxylase family protein [Methanomassiliicoccales archaeon]